MLRSRSKVGEARHVSISAQQRSILVMCPLDAIAARPDACSRTRQPWPRHPALTECPRPSSLQSHRASGRQTRARRAIDRAGAFHRPNVPFGRGTQCSSSAIWDTRLDCYGARRARLTTRVLANARGQVGSWARPINYPQIPVAPEPECLAGRQPATGTPRIVRRLVALAEQIPS
jgi:hypothetical protein